MDTGGIRADLLAWYAKHARDLPWRRAADPYAVWISEIMLQQTRVDTVVPRFEKWLSRFPTVAHLAAADEDEVMQAWAGLGYYRRAAALHAAARAVLDGHDGRVPDDAAALRTLPGIGDYTAAAIASIAFGKPVAAVDGNVERVVARLCGIDEDVRAPAGRQAIREQADRLLDSEQPGTWNQAMMELGALVCRPRPDCDACPLSRRCIARRRGVQDAIPAMPSRRPPRKDKMHFGVVMQGSSVLLVKRPRRGLLAGMWGLPGGPTSTPLGTHVREQAGLLVQTSDVAGRADHAFTHRRWEMYVKPCVILDIEPAAAEHDTRWVAMEDLPDAGLPVAFRKALLAASIPA